MQGYRTNPVHLSIIKQVQIWTHSFPWWWPHEHLAKLLSSDTVFFRHFELFLPPLILKPLLAWHEIAVLQSLTQSCPTLCYPVGCSTPGFPVLHYLLELAQTHVCWVGDAIQPSHPLSTPSPPAFNLSQHQGLFQWVSSLHQVAKVLALQIQHHSFQWIFRTDFL